MIRKCPFALNKVLLSIATMAAAGPQLAHADPVDLGTVGGNGGAATQTSVNANSGTAAAVAPTQANLSATQPQSIISRAFIENSTPPTLAAPNRRCSSGLSRLCAGRPKSSATRRCTSGIRVEPPTSTTSST